MNPASQMFTQRVRMLMLLLLAVVAASVSAWGAEPAAGFEVTEFSGKAVESDGSRATQAGAHPTVISTIRFSTYLDEEETLRAEGNIRDISFSLPPGLIGNPQATPKCSMRDLVGEIGVPLCAPETQIGVVDIGIAYFGSTPFVSPIGLHNIEPPPGVAARFGFNVIDTVITLDARVTASGGYHVVVDGKLSSQGLPVTSLKTTLWGVPADPSNDDERRPRGASWGTFPPPTPSTAPRLPFLTAATDCNSGPQATHLALTSWQEPTRLLTASFDHDVDGQPLIVEGCDEVPFAPNFEVRLSSNAAASPSGLDVRIEIPQSDDPDGLATAHLKDVEVTLPEGMAINPSSAGGLAACTDAQLGLGNDEPARCPEASKVGTVTAHTPLLAEELTGAAYVLTQQSRDPESGEMFRLGLTLGNEERGVSVKLGGELFLDKDTGQIKARFEDNPQMPVSDIEVSFKTGQRAPLATPSACGTKTATARFDSWSGRTVHDGSSFAVNGCDGGFAPKLSAGVSNPIAGAKSPFLLRLTREGGEQALTGVEVGMPKGLTAYLKGVPYCPEAAIAAASGRAGATELASPSCPAASQVGTVTVGAGVGSSPFFVETGKAYLAGPYKGAPLSLAIATPAVAGPFDLGTVMTRAAIRVEPTTAKITVDSDPIPTILGGVPLQVRDLRVAVDRPGFMVNPTSCRPAAIDALARGANGAAASLRQRFQVANCDRLGFAPRLALRLKGKTRRSGHPALTAVLRAGPGEAGIGRTSVALPRSEFLAQSHIRTICTRVQFAAESCPKGSVYGRARVFTPLLDQPLEGLVYLRSSNNTLPDMVMALRGQIDIDLVGRIDSLRGGIRTTFEEVPDAPVSKLVLKMAGGKRSLLENSRDLCGSTNRATVRMEGQNGKKRNFRPAVVAAGC